MLLDLPTRQDVEDLKALLATVLSAVQQPAAPAAADLLSLEQVAEYTGFDRRTVEKWASEGRFNEAGQRVYLPAYEFTGRLRFKRADVEAFGLGVGVLAPSCPGQRPEPIKKPANKKPANKKPKKPLASEQALKIA